MIFSNYKKRSATFIFILLFLSVISVYSCDDNSVNRNHFPPGISDLQIWKNSITSHLASTISKITPDSLSIQFERSFHQRDTYSKFQETALFFSILTATFISEDLTVITSGLLARKNEISLTAALGACFLGIFFGDIGLFLMGYLIRKFPYAKKASDWLANSMPGDKFEKIQARLKKEGWKLLFMSRFVPGTRLPVYTGAGMIGGQFVPMIVVAIIAGLLWTPLLLFFSYYFGNRFLLFFEWITGPGVWSIFFAIALLYLLHKLVFSLILRDGRMRWQVRLLRLKYTEFWPGWLFYLPVPFMIFFLGIRYRGINTLTAANPGIFAGGFIGESKQEILGHVPASFLPAYICFDTSITSSQKILSSIKRKNWKFPLILKPDISQKGIGLGMVKSVKDLKAAVEKSAGLMILQEYHPGPYEAGVFYYRFPGQQRGKLLSITKKVFPAITGDGQNSLLMLIQNHPRFVLQSSVFIERFGKAIHDIPKKGEQVNLGIAGNHFQGTQFLQANEWITAELTNAIDNISKKVSKSMGGFYFGRYDIRYKNQKKFMAGKDISIIELNGVTSESTDMYDWNLSIMSVYKIMWKQLMLAYKTGYLNTLNGHKKTPITRIIQAVFIYLKNRPKQLVSD